MATLTLSLFGRPQLALDGVPLTAITSNKALALFYYLAVSGQRHTRQSLAGLLWAELSEEDARRNLRGEVKKLTPLHPWLIIERDALAFDRQTSFVLDVDEIERVAQQREPTITQLQAAVALCRGPFLEDFWVQRAPNLEEWLEPVRYRLGQLAAQVVVRLARAYTGKRQSNVAAEAAIRHLLAWDAAQEEAHQELMKLLALSGKQAEALRQYELLSDALHRELDVLPSEASDLLYDAIARGDYDPAPLDSPLPSSAATFGPVLPPKPTSAPFLAPAKPPQLVGREELMSQLRTQLAGTQAGGRVALWGMGGAGKTTLASQLAQDLREHFADGVLWANLATSDPADTLVQWGRAFGYDFTNLRDLASRTSAVRDMLATKRVLLVLDDLRSIRRAQPLLVGGEQSATLITTRDEELAQMLDAQLAPLPDLTPSAGLELLARYVDTTRLAAEPIAAVEICSLLENLPLAIELVGRKLAARRRSRLADMAQRLHQVGGRLELAAGNLAVRTSFLVSWETLDSRLQRTFARLGLFAGRSFTTAALTHIVQGEEYLVGDQLEALSALSLVKPAGDGRYQQHSLLADFASEQLGEDQAAQVRMASYYQAFAKEHEADYAKLEPEWENLMAGMAVAHRLQQWPLVLDYAGVLTSPWFAQGRYTQARAGYGWAVEGAQQTKNEIALAQSLLRWGEACVEQNDYTEANDHFNNSLTYSIALDEKARIADVYFYQARIELVHAHYDQAEHLLNACYQLRADIEDEVGLSAILHMQGFIHYRRGNLDEAQELCERARAVQERTNSQTWAVPILRLLADIAMAQQQYAIAESYCDEALNLQQTMVNQSETVALYYNRTVVARLQNDLEAAYTYAESTLQLAQQMGNREHEAYALYELSSLLFKRQAYTDALPTGLQCIAQLRKIEDDFNLVYALDHVSQIYQETEQTDRAQLLLHEAIELARRHVHPFLDTLLQRIASLSG